MLGNWSDLCSGFGQRTHLTLVIKAYASDLCCVFGQRTPLTHVIKAYPSGLCCAFGQRTPLTHVIKAYPSGLCCAFGQRTPLTLGIKKLMRQTFVVEFDRGLLLILEVSLCVRFLLWNLTEDSF